MKPTPPSSSTPWERQPRSPGEGRWPLHRQILVPVVLILTTAIMLTALAAGYLAALRGERQTMAQLRAVSATLGQSVFPLTPPVLEKMRGLSGAHFVSYDHQEQVQVSTLANPPPLSAELARFREDTPPTFTRQPQVVIDGVSYFVAGLRPGSTSGASLLLVFYPVASWRQARWDAAVPPIVVGLGALATTVLVVPWLAHRLTHRVRLLQRQVADIAAGDFRAISAPGPRDEIRDLVASVNDMARQLRGMRATIQQAERERLLGQLAGGLAHQLRNAATGARLAMQLHQRRHARPDDESIQIALRQLSLMEEQLKGLLSLGHKERQAPTWIETRALLEEIALLVGPAAEHAHVRLSLELPPPEARVFVECQGFRAALLNLALNALEAAGAEGAVVLAARVTTDATIWEIRDNGSGPPAELHEQLYEPFVTSKPCGVGLGLALAHQCAREHAGTLSWERHEGWTIFRVTLPRANHSDL